MSDVTTSPISGIPNFRSLEGMPTTDGSKVKANVLYRSESLANLTEAAQQDLAALDIASVCDLRSQGERDRHPLVWPGQQPHLIPVETLPDTRVAGKDLITRIMLDAEGEFLAGVLRGNAADMPLAFGDSMRTIFDGIIDEEQLPLLIMCVAGKDRTGFVTANILKALGVEWGAIVADYLASKNYIDKDRLHASMIEYVDDKGAAVLTAQRLVDVGSRAEYLEASFNTIEREFGSYERYLVENCGLTPERHTRLKQLMVD